MNLETLERLADAALALDHNEKAEWYSEEELYRFFHYPKNYRFIAACDPATIKELVLLVRQCKEALELLSRPSTSSTYPMKGESSIGWQSGDGIRALDRVNKGKEALAAIEKWENGKWLSGQASRAGRSRSRKSLTILPSMAQCQHWLCRLTFKSMIQGLAQHFGG